VDDVIVVITLPREWNQTDDKIFLKIIKKITNNYNRCTKVENWATADAEMRNV
jgi:hypothetical protein